MPEALLDYEERKKLNRIVAGLYDFIEPRDRRIFIQESAGLERFVRAINLSGNPRIVAADLIGKLERFGELPERPTYNALGALLAAILHLGEVPPEDKSFIANLIVRYSLITDPRKISELRNEYNLPDQVSREPSPQHISPPLTQEKISPSPQFEVEIKDEEGLESIINSEDNFLNIHLLYGAIYCSQAVGRIEIPAGTPKGTGFMVGPDLMLTNQHVLKNQGYVQEAVVRFGYMVDASDVAPTGKVINLQPDFYYSSPAKELDYALVRLSERPLKQMSVDAKLEDKSILNLVHLGKHRGYLTLAPRLIKENDRVNIIQHPEGDPMKVVMTQNHVVADMGVSRVHYVADTMNGSSGSPVFNQKWEVVALHHSGKPYPPDSVTNALKRAWKGKFRVNEGIPTRAILEDFGKKKIIRYLPRG